ncbi:uncharacterized protein C9orf85 homolog isoform X2 [Microplitis demolitor]|uniref:uncharacterized protein C9orf85 homolog isoform X2 n=1 Tax=Microplitis demolitor TaxID=69319 RepID=UPI0004CC92EC|nr:uncharacterized protein C9orf85 homolog isoform X2 [Microplitis demolitor]
MSCQRGNSNRNRPQKHQNRHAFKNNLHDTSHTTKAINKIQVVNVCEKCKKVIEWKIKYKKYKPLKAPGKCCKCEQRCVKHAYHIMCGPCASKLEVCPKCGDKTELVKPEVEDKPLTLDRELRLMLKTLPERRRRTFLRYMNRNGVKKDAAKPGDSKYDDEDEYEDDESNSDTETLTAEEAPLTRDDLVNKLKSLMVTKKNKNVDDSDCDSDEHETSTSSSSYSDNDTNNDGSSDDDDDDDDNDDKK